MHVGGIIGQENQVARVAEHAPCAVIPGVVPVEKVVEGEQALEEVPMDRKIVDYRAGRSLSCDLSWKLPVIHQAIYVVHVGVSEIRLDDPNGVGRIKRGLRVDFVDPDKSRRCHRC